ncbi:hypothetical protein [Amycolatopsis viridis]|uniref:Secreted protein n=1 Tax=Amycolatopsis viridis TaxID=185678 RepID=A0ABX0SRX1_9PSEU|nr:hypothetical protein [Amycolatopsis viridis]NIH79712.1 hypothetical protein [Amycolatopsis viridis]
MSAPTFWPLPAGAMAFAVAPAGGLIRDCSGFGGPMAGASCRCLVLPSPSVVPSTLWEFASSTALAPPMWPDAHRRSPRRPPAGTLAGVAVGSRLYRRAAGDVRRIVLGILAAVSLAPANQAVRK